ncbi:hypothetical protein DSCOOX_10530 [Desulfosarcina ovata subsp. ovata]|uniref:Uncharacterized protein n=2 Tax=Desulfosarcina ovata TaxID=83564 RepID=A0A5K8A5I9_9BACT|nr:hypothetical protein DSCOOX_10530 [Desulfosarcina ovata subsp. ovata]
MLLRIIKTIFRCLIWMTIAFSIIFPLIFFFGAKPFGILEAKYDLFRGRYEIHGYGLIHGEPQYAPILKKYGVRYRHVAGCVITDFIIDSVASYNFAMKDAIERNLGLNLDEIWMSLYGTKCHWPTSEELHTAEEFGKTSSKKPVNGSQEFQTIMQTPIMRAALTFVQICLT